MPSTDIEERQTYGEQFDRLFPYYLSIGMTKEQYWDEDPKLVVSYRKAEELRVKRRDQESWIQGYYVYEAFLRVSPILHAFAKKGARPEKYLDAPLTVTEERKKQKTKESQQFAMEQGKMAMETYMARINKQFEGK